jgi:hypothetical protein
VRAGLTVRRQPTVAWLAMIVCIATVTIDLAALGREQRFLVSDETVAMARHRDRPLRDPGNERFRGLCGGSGTSRRSLGAAGGCCRL